jgi:hypothetical protein
MSIDLNNYMLPAGVLPLSRNRYILRDYSSSVLSEAVTWKTCYPEKRGLVSRAIQTLGAAPQDISSDDSLTIEGHIDGRGITRDLDDHLLLIGFEPDGFVKYIPETYDFHRTLKFRISRSRRARIRELRHRVVQSCENAYSILNNVIEAYIELEVYPHSSRETWADVKPRSGWLEDQSIENEGLVWLSSEERQSADIPPSVSKRADIHIKLAPSTPDDIRFALIDKFQRHGFHHVTTWAGNHICTAEFAKANDARRISQILRRYFTLYGGAIEMTFERVTQFWRTCFPGEQGSIQSRLPPLIVSTGTRPWSVTPRQNAAENSSRIKAKLMP